ncbi:hypothetical protein IV203_015022 [Nitzschia inconspicua]|uniref:Uncharacterized protein n=1 Tax=Nitzschia inconspicua TaxID=303405 RepID=A0A9K3LB44_9STRA|nr:hypothetical protein IV203_015022 [Nitzschia inconspicua]
MDKGKAAVAPVHKAHLRVVDDLATEGLMGGASNGRQVGLAKLLEGLVAGIQVGKGAIATVVGEELGKGEGGEGQRCHVASWDVRWAPMESLQLPNWIHRRRRGGLSRASGQAATAKFNRHRNGDVLRVGASKVSGWCQWKFFNCHIEAMGVGGNVQVEPVEKLQRPYSTAILDGWALVGISDWRQ